MKNLIILLICLVFITSTDVEMVRSAVISLRHLAAVEKERAKLEKRFLERPDIWNFLKKDEKQ